MRVLLLVPLVFLAVGCATVKNPPPRVEHVELDRFMGDWYVVAGIVTYFEKDSYNPVESYELMEDGRIATTYTYRDGSFDGKKKSYTPVGYVHDTETNAEWRMQFLWPFKTPYLITYLDEDYRFTAVTVPDRKYVWIMSREWKVSDQMLEPIIDRLAEVGYDPAEIRRIPQQW